MNVSVIIVTIRKYSFNVEIHTHVKRTKTASMYKKNNNTGLNRATFHFILTFFTKHNQNFRRKTNEHDFCMPVLPTTTLFLLCELCPDFQQHTEVPSWWCCRLWLWDDGLNVLKVVPHLFSKQIDGMKNVFVPAQLMVSTSYRPSAI